MAREGGCRGLPVTSASVTGMRFRWSDRETATATCWTALRMRTGRSIGPVIIVSSKEFAIPVEAVQKFAAANPPERHPIRTGNQLLHLRPVLSDGRTFLFEHVSHVNGVFQFQKSATPKP